MTNSPVPALYLTRILPARNMARFYRLEIRGDLLGGVVLVQGWGRIGTAGQQRRRWFARTAEAEAERQIWMRRKIARGYQAVPA